MCPYFGWNNFKTKSPFKIVATFFFTWKNLYFVIAEVRAHYPIWDRFNERGPEPWRGQSWVSYEGPTQCSALRLQIHFLHNIFTQFYQFYQFLSKFGQFSSNKVGFHDMRLSDEPSKTFIFKTCTAYCWFLTIIYVFDSPFPSLLIGQFTHATFP